MAPIEQNAVVMFADLGSSTELYERLGDAAARKIVADCLERAVAVVGAHDGRVVKTIGDEVLAIFSDVDAAASAANDIVEAFSSSLAVPGMELGVHVGFHRGPVIDEDSDVFGDTVNVAARIVGLAKISEVLTTRPVIDQLSPRWLPYVRPVARLPIRGKRQELEVFAIVQHTSDTTVIAPASRRGQPTLRLTLQHAGTEYYVDEAHPVLTIGRSRENDIVFPSPLVSRHHARIRLRQGRFVLFDESSNGTAVRSADGTTLLVHRDSVTLVGQGALAPGPDAASGDPVVPFRIGDGPA
jgi:adenylate cyclase